MDTTAKTFYEQVVNICSCLPKKTKSVNVSKEFWMPDHSCRICCDCDCQFTIFNRRHHCRVCGRIFCGSCSANSIPAPSNEERKTGGEEEWEERIRVCNYCFKQWEQEKAADNDNRIQVSSPILSTSPAAMSSQTNRSIVEEFINSDGCDTTSLYDLEGKDIEPVDVESNGLLWLPPGPEDSEDEMEDFLFDDDVTEEWGYLDSSSRFSSGEFRSTGRSSEKLTKAIKTVVDGHFGPLVAHLLQVENLTVGEEDGNESWLEIITSLCWKAATLIKPDTSKGGDMDPGGYVKVKCLACGRRSESMVVKGVVCKKNVAHWRMTSKIDKPRFLILGGALEYHQASNYFSSIDTLTQQEMDHLNMVVAKIDAQHPNVLLVEKTVSGFAQKYLHAKDITLVLNIKRPLLESIARCTEARIVPSIDHLPSQKLGYCDTFHVEKFFEEHGSAGQSGKKLVKTLMFFEGFPKPLYYTILLKGANGDELKKVKHVVQNGVLAAYQLAMETCFLADEGATLPELPLKSPITVALPDKPSSTDGSISTIPAFTVPATDKALGSQTSTEPLKPSNPSSSGLSKEDFPQGTPEHQGILVSLSSRCIWKGTVCERAHLFRIKYYGSSDKPLGRFLRDHLFDQTFMCRSCEMPSEAHVHSYTHRQGTLTISVKKLPDVLLPGEREGKIWMWHRCLRCPRTNGFPPATRRVVMSDAAWGLSFGKFLELSFSNHAGASCGHSLHRDCLRFYGFGRMVACFHYVSIGVHSVFLPPSTLDFKYDNQEWIQKEANEVFSKAQHLFTEIRNILHQMVEKRSCKGSPNINSKVAKPKCCFIVNLERMLPKEQAEFEECFHKILNREVKSGQPIIDILEINRLRRQLFFHSYLWDRRLVYATSFDDNCLQEKCSVSIPKREDKPISSVEKPAEINSTTNVGPLTSGDSLHVGEDLNQGGNHPNEPDIIHRGRSVDQDPNHLREELEEHSKEDQGASNANQFLGLTIPIKVADNIEESTTWLKMSFIDFYQSTKKKSAGCTQLDTLGVYNPVYVSSFRELEHIGVVRFFLPMGVNDTVVPVYDGEVTSVISFALVSPDYHVQLSDERERLKDGLESSVSLQTYDSMDLHTYDSFDETTSEVASEFLRTLVYSKSLHINVSFTDDGPFGKVKYTVTCYYAKRFDALRRICCSSELDFIRSLARCKKWEAQGGKRNVFFAKTLDDRFIIKQVTKTELESFMQFAPEYFKYVSKSIVEESPTCLAKILGIYQVTTKHHKGGKESRMDVLVMENLLFGRNVTRLYDLKGSSCSRYNPDASGSNKVLLDQNLIEAMPTSPIFVGNKAKRLLERAVWNDTSFFESIDVMDYSLLVGVDEEKHELVLGTIDFLKQYTWDKHLETWVKSLGIHGGSKNTSPTVISPKQYKKRFRKAMSEYFFMVPDQWSPPTIIPSGLQSDLYEENKQERSRISFAACRFKEINLIGTEATKFPSWNSFTWP